MHSEKQRVTVTLQTKFTLNRFHIFLSYKRAWKLPLPYVMYSNSCVDIRNQEFHGNNFHII